MADLKQRTQDACDQLQRYGGKVEDELVADLLDAVAEINDDIANGLANSVLRESIRRAQQKLDKLAQRG